MRIAFIKSCVGVTAAMAVMLILPALASAQSGTAPQANHTKDPLADKPFNPRELSGIWDPALAMQPKNEVHPFAFSNSKYPLPPFSDAGQKQYETNVKFIATGDVLDCNPLGTARNFFTPRPFEIIKSSDRLIQHFEYYSDWREIWTDGRKIPSDAEPDFMGYSIGHWDGNTFVVESAAYNGLTFLSWTGLPMSAEMHQTERWQRVNYDTLKIEFTFNDPKMYSKPWMITYFYKLKPDWTLDAQVCTLAGIRQFDNTVTKTDGLSGLNYKGPK